METNPSFDDYAPQDFEQVRRACLHIATVLGTSLDELTVVGGMVPALLIDQGGQEVTDAHHPGTMDLDLGMSLAVLDETRYAAISEQLRNAGFSPDKNDRGNNVFQRWRTPPGGPKVTVDFLMPQVSKDQKPDRVFKLEQDFGAIVTPGLQLVERDWRPVRVEGLTLNDEQASRVVRVCGPGAFMVLKARAIHKREKNKDAFDLYYVLRFYGQGIEDVAAALKPLLDDADAREAIAWLRSDFAYQDSLGPARAARFVHRTPRLNPDYDPEEVNGLQTLVWALVQDLLKVIA